MIALYSFIIWCLEKFDHEDYLNLFNGLNNFEKNIKVSVMLFFLKNIKRVFVIQKRLLIAWKERFIIFFDKSIIQKFEK